MKHQTTSRILMACLVFALSFQPLAVQAQTLQAASRLQGQNRLAQTGIEAPNTIFLPIIVTPPGPPDFEITSPSDGWTVSGMLYLAAQPRDPKTVTRVAFSAATTSLGVDNTPGDGYQVFFDASAFPAGNLTLTAVASGPSGQTSKSITVNVLPNPPSSGVIGSQGGVLGSEIGSIITIPPGALPDGTSVSVDELTQQEVTAQNGINWDAMGVTFLGAQSIQSPAPISLPYRVASADFGNRVQPGQVVVNYQIMPDADGDGVDEIVVVNSASVAPNNDVISDPIPQVLLKGSAVVSSQSFSVAGVQAGISGPPGTSIEVETTGFNPYSLSGNVAVFLSSVDGTKIELPALLSPDLDGQSSSQTLSAILPILPAGPATLSFRNESTGATTQSIAITVEEPTPINRPASDIIHDFFTQSLATLNGIQTSVGTNDKLAQLIIEFTETGSIFEQLSSDPSPAVQQFLIDAATLIENSGILAQANQLEADSISRLLAGCFTKTQLKIIRSLVLVGITLTSLGCAIIFSPLAGGLCAAGLTIVFGMIEIWFLGDAECPPPTPALVCSPSQTGGGSGLTGMGSAPPPGGNGCGNVGGGGGGAARAPQAASPVIIKVFSAGSPIPFSGVADPGGYFFVPLIPAGEPFTAVAYDVANNKTRIIEGVGPATGDFVFLFFDFFHEQPGYGTVYWDGEGDGTSWHDPFNWKPNLIPGPTQNVIIDVPGAVTIVHSRGADAVLSLKSEAAIVLSGGTLDIGQASVLTGTLTMSGGTLAGNGDVAVAGMLTWNNGTMSGIGTTRANGGLTFSGSYGRYLDGRSLENAGAAVFLDGSLTAYHAAVIANLAGATFDFQGDDFIYSSTGGATFDNQGTLSKSAGSGSASIYVPLNNSGVVDVQAGTLTLRGGGVDAGSFQGAGTLEIGGGSHTLSGSLSGLNVRLSSGTLTLSGTYTATNTTLAGGTFSVSAGLTAGTGALTMSGGTLTGNGDVDVAGLLTWNYGTMSGIGTTRANGGLTFSGSYGRYLDGRSLENAGTAALLDGSLTAYHAAVIANLAGATFDFQGDDFIYSSTGGATFDNQGTLSKSAGSGSASIYIPLNNSGVVDVQAGTLTLRGGGMDAGSFQGAGTLEIGGGSHTLSGSLSGLNVRLSSGTLTLSGTYTAANTTLAGGTLSVSAGLTAGTSALTMSGGTLTGNGDVDVAGMLTWNYGTMSGIGTTRANGGLTFSGSYGRYLDGRSLENAGAAVLLDGSLTAYHAAVIANLAGATFDFQGDDFIYISTGGASFQNHGSLTKSGGSGETRVNPAFVNSGSVDVQSGQLRFGGDFTQTASGVLHVKIGGQAPITEYDQFAIVGNATLDGALDVTLAGGYVPTLGDSFIVMTFAARAGQFATIDGHGQGYTVNYNPKNVTLVAQ